MDAGAGSLHHCGDGHGNTGPKPYCGVDAGETAHSCHDDRLATELVYQLDWTECYGRTDRLNSTHIAVTATWWPKLYGGPSSSTNRWSGPVPGCQRDFRGELAIPRSTERTDAIC